MSVLDLTDVGTDFTLSDLLEAQRNARESGFDHFEALVLTEPQRLCFYEMLESQASFTAERQRHGTNAGVRDWNGMRVQVV
jgi:hypothetical protein